MSDHSTQSTNFRVNLAGIVELLSGNLYSGPRVFVRELLQNGLDAITARRDIDPECPARIRFVTDGQTLTVTDTGIGLSAAEAEDLLATIGATSKRDELGFSREDYLGQFGIGMISCFMVSTTIVVYTRSAKKADAPVVRWEGRPDGTWSSRQAEADEIPVELTGPGTTVVLTGLPGERWFDYRTLATLISDYGQYLPVDVTLERPTTDAEHLADNTVPWELTPAAQAEWCREHFGFKPMFGIRLDVPVAGLKGLAYVLPTGAHPSAVPKNRVYLRRMLVTDACVDLLPDWAYFVRVVADAEHLKPTAGRESLFDDSLLAETREALGQAVRDWLSALAREQPDDFRHFIALHATGLKSLGITDPTSLKMVVDSVPYQTSLGLKTLGEVLKKTGSIRYVTTEDQFRAVLPVAEANNLCVVNAGYVYDEQILEQLKIEQPSADVAELKPEQILGVLSPLDASTEARFLDFLSVAEKSLEGQDIICEVRGFSPATLPVVFLSDPEAAGIRLDNRMKDKSGGIYAGLVDIMCKDRPGEHAPRLIFNATTPIVNELAASVIQAPLVVESAVRGFYIQALMTGQHPMDAQVRAWAANLYTPLIRASLKNSATTTGGGAAGTDTGPDTPDEPVS
ncbi:HSP90 family protein [Corynebacterium mendelii]|uniref:HSP90 family protein n=1 Tax=Corynebacterium mendelii TaxID=2765362 RepID=A0A939E191_9CORY|nr:HSP90 family protein [Corynebacterium mendelii]